MLDTINMINAILYLQRFMFYVVNNRIKLSGREHKYFNVKTLRKAIVVKAFLLYLPE